MPFAGTLYFDTDSPLRGNEYGDWVTHGDNGGLRLRFGESQWAFGFPGEGSCEVLFHVGWNLTRAFCDSPVEGSDWLFLEFFDESGQLFYWDYDPIGPFDGSTPDLYHLTATARVFRGPEQDYIDMAGTLDSVRLVSEPAMFGTLLCVGLAAGFASRRRRLLSDVKHAAEAIGFR